MAEAPEALIERVKADPEFQKLVRHRSSLAWSLTTLMIAIYFGFILAIAFGKEQLGASLSGGVTTVGIPVGLGVILSAFVLTGLYVWRANSTFDEMTKAIIERARKQ